MRNLIALVTIGLMTSITANATQRIFQDVKLPTQSVLENQNFVNPIVATTNAIKTTYAGPTSAAALVLTSFTAQPDLPRNITVTPTGTTTDVESCVITIAGTNIKNNAISDTVTFAANASTIQVTSKAFKSVTSVTWPADCESGGFAATWVIGVGEKLGLNKCMAYAGDWAWSVFAGAYETTRATVTAHATDVSSNTADFNGTMDGSADFIGRYIQNFNPLCL